MSMYRLPTVGNVGSQHVQAEHTASKQRPAPVRQACKKKRPGNTTSWFAHRQHQVMAGACGGCRHHEGQDNSAGNRSILPPPNMNEHQHITVWKYEYGIQAAVA